MKSLLLVAALAAGQSPVRNLTNAQVETRQATQTVEREIAGIAASKDNRWVGYRIAVTRGRRLKPEGDIVHALSSMVSRGCQTLRV